MIFILKLTINMELIDTPNPNAKKIEIVVNENEVSEKLNNVNGISSIFFGPGFVTVTKEDNKDWKSITEDIVNIFDKL
tara:strand:+ start:416 stop:649 length:234 start_codon:yes stop_codon:yes gene_type:complete